MEDAKVIIMRGSVKSEAQVLGSAMKGGDEMGYDGGRGRTGNYVMDPVLVFWCVVAKF